LSIVKRSGGHAGSLRTHGEARPRDGTVTLRADDQPRPSSTMSPRALLIRNAPRFMRGEPRGVRLRWRVFPDVAGECSDTEVRLAPARHPTRGLALGSPPGQTPRAAGGRVGIVEASTACGRPWRARVRQRPCRSARADKAEVLPGKEPAATQTECGGHATTVQAPARHVLVLFAFPPRRATMSMSMIGRLSAVSSVST